MMHRSHRYLDLLNALRLDSIPRDDGGCSRGQQQSAAHLHPVEAALIQLELPRKEAIALEERRALPRVAPAAHDAREPVVCEGVGGHAGGAAVVAAQVLKAGQAQALGEAAQRLHVFQASARARPC